jgi:hypothetical protein
LAVGCAVGCRLEGSDVGCTVGLTVGLAPHHVVCCDDGLAVDLATGLAVGL